MDITFRSVRPKDAKALFDVKIAAYGDEFREFQYAQQGYQEAVDDCNAKRPDGMFSRKWHKMFSSRKQRDWSLVMLDGKKIIGQIIAFPGKYFKENYAAYDMSGSVNVIFCIYVLPEYKNRGVGQMAMEHMERLRPADKWILDTPKISPKNKHFYEKCGYTQGQSGDVNVYVKGF